MLDRLTLIAILAKAILVGLAASVAAMIPARAKPFVWFVLAFALASCVVLAAQ